jgi:hypothetical protein
MVFAINGSRTIWVFHLRRAPDRPLRVKEGAMKFREALFTAGFFALACARAADVGIEFAGVLTNDGHTKIAVTDKATNTTTWLEPGDTFRGYTIARYDAKEDALFLRKNGEETRLSLVASKIPEGTTAVAATAPTAVATAPAAPVQAPPTEAAANAIRSNLRMLASAARRYQLEHGQVPVTYGQLVGPGKSISELRSLSGENYANLTFPPTATTLTVTMSDGAPVSIDLPAAPSPANATAVAVQTPTPATAPIAVPSPPVAAPPGPVAAAIPPTPTPAPESKDAYPATNPNNTPTNETVEPTGRPSAPTSFTTGQDETWESVAQKTGVSVQKLKELNSPIPSGGSLPSGQTVRIR